MNVNARLKEFVETNGIKQIHIAEKTGLSADTISKILNGQRRILADEFLIICEQMNINPDIFREPRA